ncbi:MAG: hypothetical protein ABIK07_15150 [Planctomycetota bacterium]
MQTVEMAAVSKANDKHTPVRRWNYSQDFRKPEPIQITPWQSLAQILLLSNEFQFVD